MEVTAELKRATLTQALVGSDKEKLIPSVSQSVCVCEELGKYIRFEVDINNSEQPGVQQPTLSTGTARNAFSVLITAQRQIQQGDNGVPLTIQVKTNKDRLYDDLIQLMELGVKWNDPNAYAVPFLKKL